MLRPWDEVALPVRNPERVPAARREEIMTEEEDEVDRIILAGIDVYAYGGVSEAERTIGQRYRIDLEIEIDLSVPARTDRVEDTVSYADVHAAVVATMRERRFHLIESAAGRIADRVLQEFPVGSVSVRLAKLLPPIDGVVASAAVEITRSRDRA